MKVLNKEELHKIFAKLKEDKQEIIFNELYNQYNNLVYRIAFSIVKNKESSEDIRQVVFLKIWNMEQKDLPSKSESSWLYTLTKNETLNYIRKQEKAIKLEDIYYIDNENEELTGIIDRESYNKLICKLSPKEQEMISLKILANLSFREIAQILNESQGTIKWRYYKSLHTLKILLSNLGMFVVTFIMGLKLINSEKKNCQNTENIMEETTNKESGIEEEKQNSTSEISNINENFIQADTTNNEIGENANSEITGEIIIQKPQGIHTNYYGIGILSISGIFLIITLIFTIFFTKYQLKARKKVSK